MVLGKGSFGKVWFSFSSYISSRSIVVLFLRTQTGHVGREEGHRRAVRHQDIEEGHHHPGRRRRVHHGGEEGVGVGSEAAVLGADALLLPNYGERDTFFWKFLKAPT